MNLFSPILAGGHKVHTQLFFLIFSATERETETKFGYFSQNLIRVILMSTEVCQLTGCCYGNKVLHHYFPNFCKKAKICAYTPPPPRPPSPGRDKKKQSIFLRFLSIHHHIENYFVCYNRYSNVIFILL